MIWLFCLFVDNNHEDFIVDPILKRLLSVLSHNEDIVMAMVDFFY